MYVLVIRLFCRLQELLAIQLHYQSVYWIFRQVKKKNVYSARLKLKNGKIVSLGLSLEIMSQFRSILIH